MTYDIDERKRRLALFVLCLGVLMIVLDTTIVTFDPPYQAGGGFFNITMRPESREI